MDLSFSGAGFMGCYYFGVVDCWNKYIPRDRVNRVAGASAGSLIAAYYLMDLPLNSCLKKIIELTEDIRSRPLGVFDRSNQIVDVLPRVLDELFPEDAHKKVTGRLHIVMTRLKDMKKVVVNEFENRKDLIDALNCSCFIPVWSGNHVSTYKGVKHIDGGFSDNLPVFDEYTIRICCFSGATDISPYDKSRKEMLSGTVLNMPLYFTFANFKRGRRALFPPAADYILSLLENGFHDTKTFILDNDLIQCNSCWNKTDRSDQQIYSQISPSITPAISRANSSLNLNDLIEEEQDEGLNENHEPKRKNKENFLSPKDNRLRSSFSKLLSSKLVRIIEPSSSSKDNEPLDNENNHNSNNMITMPTIVIEDSTDILPMKASPSSSDTSSGIGRDLEEKMTINSKQSLDLFGEKRKRRQSCDFDEMSTFRNRQRSNANSPAASTATGQRAFQERRNTIMSISNNDLLVIQDRFRLAPESLPSCPPSPNLNRHCSECARMRQEARNDNLEQEIRLEAEKFKVPEVNREGISKKLKSPLRWIKQLTSGQKNSYKFEQVGSKRQIPVV